MRIAPIALICLAFAAPVAAQQPQPQGELGDRSQSPEALFREMSSETPEQEMARLVAAAAAYPLGTIENPVRVGGPNGERTYLARLSCVDGTPIHVGARSEAGQGGFGAIACQRQRQRSRDRFDTPFEAFLTEAGGGVETADANCAPLGSFLLGPFDDTSRRFCQAAANVFVRQHLLRDG